MSTDFYTGTGWCRDTEVSGYASGGGDKKFKGAAPWGQREGEGGAGKSDLPQLHTPHTRHSIPLRNGPLQRPWGEGEAWAQTRFLVGLGGGGRFHVEFMLFEFILS